MADRTETTRRIVDRLQAGDIKGLQWPELRQGFVTAVDLTTTPTVCTVQLSGDDEIEITDVPCLQPYVPTVNDAVFLLKNGSDLIAVGVLNFPPAVKPARPPRCKAYRSAATINIVDNTLTIINFTAEVFDSHGMHDTVTQSSRFTPNVAGLYWCVAAANWGNGSVGQRLAQLFKNGTTVIQEVASPGVSANVTAQQVASLIPFNGTTDYVEMRVRQTSGGGLDINGGAEHQTSFNIFWVADDSTSV